MDPYLKDMSMVQDELLRINVELDEQSKKGGSSNKKDSLPLGDFPPLGRGRNDVQSRPPSGRSGDRRVQIRDRSRSAFKGFKNSSNKDEPKFSNKTFAEMVQNSKTKPDSIRNIRINAETEEETKRIRSHLSSNYACQDVGIKKISNRSADYITITCKTESDAKNLKER